MIFVTGCDMGEKKGPVFPALFLLNGDEIAAILIRSELCRTLRAHFLSHKTEISAINHHNTSRVNNARYY